MKTTHTLLVAAGLLTLISACSSTADSHYTSAQKAEFKQSCEQEILSKGYRPSQAVDDWVDKCVRKRLKDVAS